VSLGLGFLPRTVPELTARSSFGLTVVHLSESIIVRASTKLRVCGTLLQDLTRQDVEDERHMDVTSES